MLVKQITRIELTAKEVEQVKDWRHTVGNADARFANDKVKAAAQRLYLDILMSKNHVVINQGVNHNLKIITLYLEYKERPIKNKVISELVKLAALK